MVCLVQHATGCQLSVVKFNSFPLMSWARTIARKFAQRAVKMPGNERQPLRHSVRLRRESLRIDHHDALIRILAVPRTIHYKEPLGHSHWTAAIQRRVQRTSSQTYRRENLQVVINSVTGSPGVSSIGFGQVTMSRSAFYFRFYPSIPRIRVLRS